MIMKKTFRPWQVDQSLLLPPSVHDFVACDHPAHFIRDLVRDQLDITAIVESYDEARGYPPYDPWMMTALLLYGYSRGVYSSRRLARGCEERLDFMAVTALNKPDFRTISDFRKRHLVALSDLFVQVLRLCQKAGLVELGHVALDGTKIKANASKHIDAIEANTGRRPGEASADVGYCSESNLEALEERRVRAYLATGRQKHPDGGEAQRRGPKVEAMRQRLRRGGYRSRYRLRKQIVEPVFGQIKEARGFRQFLMRGIDKVSGEWALICTVHNILKLQKAT
mgnify:CR=1 FL=1